MLPAMIEFELLRILDFVRKARGPFEAHIGFAKPDARWNILLTLIASALEGRALTITALIAASETPYGSTNRLIRKLIERGDIVLSGRTGAGKSHLLHPSEGVMAAFHRYAGKLKMLLAQMLGLGRSTPSTSSPRSGPLARATVRRIDLLHDRDPHHPARPARRLLFRSAPDFRRRDCDRPVPARPDERLLRHRLERPPQYANRQQFRDHARLLRRLDPQHRVPQRRLARPRRRAFDHRGHRGGPNRPRLHDAVDRDLAA